MALSHDAGWDPDFCARSPWLWPVAGVARALGGCARWPTLEQLGGLQGGGPRFVPDARASRHARQPGLAYDASIALHGQVPTRPGNWHDLLNALCFAAWPRSKRALHTRQHRAAAREPQGQPHGRGRERDTLTLFDEGGALVAAADAGATIVHRALHAPDHQALWALLRARRARVVLFGHALLEHLVASLPCPGASARVLVLRELPLDDATLLSQLDSALAAELANPKCFLVPNEAVHLRVPADEPFCSLGRT